MARIVIDNGNLIINMSGARKIFSLKSELTIPLKSIIGISEGLNWQDIPNIFEKRAGTNAYGLYLGGTYVQNGNRIFYDVLKKEDVIVLQLEDDEFNEIVIGVENPEETKELIKNAIRTEV